MARDPRTPDCVIDGCTRAEKKAGLCAEHYKLVPKEMALNCMMACASASATTAMKWHLEMQRRVKNVIAYGGVQAGS